MYIRNKTKMKDTKTPLASSNGTSQDRTQDRWIMDGTIWSNQGDRDYEKESNSDHIRDGATTSKTFKNYIGGAWFRTVTDGEKNI